MYLMKIYRRGKGNLMDVKHFEHFENAVASLISKHAFENLTDEDVITLGKPGLYFASVNKEKNVADDFEFRYENGITVYIGQVCPSDNEYHH